MSTFAQWFVAVWIVFMALVAFFGIRNDRRLKKFYKEHPELKPKDMDDYFEDWNRY